MVHFRIHWYLFEIFSRNFSRIGNFIETREGGHEFSLRRKFLKVSGLLLMTYLD